MDLLESTSNDQARTELPRAGELREYREARIETLGMVIEPKDFAGFVSEEACF